MMLRLAELVNNVRQEVLPDTDDISGLQTMGSEDMAYLMDEIPGCYVFVGSKNEEQESESTVTITPNLILMSKPWYRVSP